MLSETSKKYLEFMLLLSWYFSEACWYLYSMKSQSNTVQQCISLDADEISKSLQNVHIWWLGGNKPKVKEQDRVFTRKRVQVYK